MTTRAQHIALAFLVLLVIISSFYSINSIASYNEIKSVDLVWMVDTGLPVDLLAWSYDSQYIAIFKDDGTLGVYNKDGTLVWSKNYYNDWIGSIAWSPTTDYLAVATTYYVYVIDENGDVIWQSMNLSSDIWGTGGLEWSPDGSKLAIFTNFGPLYVYNSDWELLWNTEYIENLSTFRIEWSPDGSRLAAESESESVYLFDADGNLLANLHPVSEDYIYGFSWSPDGSKLAIRYSNSIYIYYRDGTLLWSYSCPGSEGISSHAWSPDGTLLAVGLYNGKVIVFNYQGEIQAEYQVLSNSSSIEDIVWNPLGDYFIAVGSDSLVLVDNTNQTIITKYNLKDWYHDVIYHSSGKLVAVGDFSGTLYVFDKYLNLIYISKTYGPPVSAMSWSPDSEYLAVGGSFSKLLLYKVVAQSPLIGSGTPLLISNETASILLERNVSIQGIFGTINGEWVSGYEFTVYYTIREIDGNISTLRIIYSFSPDIVTSPDKYLFYSNATVLDPYTNFAIDIIHPQVGVTYIHKFVIITDADQETVQQGYTLTYQLKPGENATQQEITLPPETTTTTTSQETTTVPETTTTGSPEETQTTPGTQTTTTTQGTKPTTTQQPSTSPETQTEETTPQANNIVDQIKDYINKLNKQQQIILAIIILIILIIIIKKLR